MATVTLRRLKKSYGATEIVKGIDLEVAQGEFIVFVGPSGCGKSTTLRMIAGLEDISAGEILIDGLVVNDVMPGARDIAMVFQNYALYPHMTVFRNIAFGLQRQGMAKADIAKRIADVARILEIEPLLERKPRALSGGQRQRVAMGRAIARSPRLFLFDEPLSNLDARLRSQMRVEIRRLHDLFPTTTIYVTHDQVEAMTLADRVVVLNAGKIEQVGPPDELYRSPRSQFVAGFIGSPAMNFLPARIETTAQGQRAVFHNGEAIPLNRRFSVGPEKSVTIGIRPEAIICATGRCDLNGFFAEMNFVERLGAESLLHFDRFGQRLCARIDAELAPRTGDRIELAIDTARMHLFDGASGESIAS